MEKLCSQRETITIHDSNNNGNNKKLTVKSIKERKFDKPNSNNTVNVAANDNRSQPVAGKTRLATLAQIGEDWLYLALLGIIMALLSFYMDSVITLFLNTRLWLFKDLSEDNLFIQYLGWCVAPIVLVTFSSAFVHLCSPTVSPSS